MSSTTILMRKTMHCASWLGLTALVSLACSSEEAGSRLGGSASNNAGSNGEAGASGADDGLMFGGDPIAPNGPSSRLEAEEVCETIPASATPAMVDIYIMLDQSVSMAEKSDDGVVRWDAVKTAITAFVNDPRSDGIGVGIDYFGVGFDTEENCIAANYAEPSVAIADLPANRQPLIDSINGALGPASSSRTPTYAALDGAIQHATAHADMLAAANSTRQTVVVLVSDGFPTECEQSLPKIAALARAGFERTTPVRTIAVALSEGESNAKAIAEAGGGRAFSISNADDVATSFLEALLAAASTPLACTYPIPPADSAAPDRQIDGDRAEVRFHSAARPEPEYLTKFESSQGCASGGEGFYFDREIAPTVVTLCNTTCNRLGAGDLTISLACVDPGAVIE